jgi:2,4-dienoyl-CoA reductase-like NADH-dependent reductase (Old Yellow Enzyme family)
MKRLYQPATINSLQLKNRLVMAPMGIGNTVDGYVTDQDREFSVPAPKAG